MSSDYRVANFDLVDPFLISFAVFKPSQGEGGMLERKDATGSKAGTKEQDEWSQLVEMAFRRRGLSYVQVHAARRTSPARFVDEISVSDMNATFRRLHINTQLMLPGRAPIIGL